MRDTGGRLTLILPTTTIRCKHWTIREGTKTLASQVSFLIHYPFIPTVHPEGTVLVLLHCSLCLLFISPVA